MQRNDSSTAQPRWVRAAAMAALGAAALAAAGAAQARDDVFWSVGLASPGVQVGLSNSGPQVYMQPAPVYMQPAPVYVQPAPVYVQPRPVYVQPAPVMYRPAPVYYQPAPMGYRSVGWAPPGHAYGYYGQGDHRKVQRHGRDRNHDGIPDHRQDFNGDGRPDWTRR